MILFACLARRRDNQAIRRHWCTMKENLEGYLVVLKTPECQSEAGKRLNPRYAGVNRVPAYPSDYREEQSALDEYFFGNFKSMETNLIPELSSAGHLLKMLSASPREFEIILCCAGPTSKDFQAFRREQILGLGYDVAVVQGDCWSIVSDFTESDWSRSFLRRLNEFGLFTDRADALNYLREYRAHGEADADMPFEVTYVARVKSEAASPQ